MRVALAHVSGVFHANAIIILAGNCGHSVDMCYVAHFTFILRSLKLKRCRMVSVGAPEVRTCRFPTLSVRSCAGCFGTTTSPLSSGLGGGFSIGCTRGAILPSLRSPFHEQNSLQSLHLCSHAAPTALVAHNTVVANARQQRSGQPRESEGGGWSFFTLPAAKVGKIASSASTTPAGAAAAATTTSMQGALAGWMIMSAPSAKKYAASIVTTRGEHDSVIHINVSLTFGLILA